MTTFVDRLNSGPILLADGAMGTMLIQSGLEPGHPPESVTLSNPGALEEVARVYLNAGADVIQTNTFGASPARLSTYGLDDKTEELNEAAVRAVRNVVADRAYVAGSCGPSGKLLQPYGDVAPEQLYEGFRRQTDSLIAAGVDCVFVETMIDLHEARLAVQAVKDSSSHTPVVVTMTFDPTPRGFYTIMGVDVETAAVQLAEAGADGVGSNCGNGIENMVAIARDFKAACDLPLIIQSNAGMPQTVGGEVVYGETPEFMAEEAKGLVSSGVSVIGGCCGTTPEHIAALRAVVDQAT